MVKMKLINFNKYFYRELGINLENIKNIINSPNFDSLSALKEHHNKLLAKRKQIDLLIENVTKTIALKEGKYTMTDIEKFEGFKEKMIDENEKIMELKLERNMVKIL